MDAQMERPSHHRSEASIDAEAVECVSPMQSPHLNEAIPFFDQFDDLREEWLEPLEEGSTAGIADPQPDNDRSDPALPVSVGEVLVLRHDDGLPFQGVFPDRRIVGVPQADLGHVFGSMAEITEKPRQSRGQLGIDHEMHGLSDLENGMICLLGGVFQTGGDVFRLEVGKVFEDLGLGDFRGEQVENILYPDAHPANAGTTATLVRIESDAFGHGKILRQPRGWVKAGERGNRGDLSIVPPDQDANFRRNLNRFDPDGHEITKAGYSTKGAQRQRDPG
jgi:hypothetical protein